MNSRLADVIVKFSQSMLSCMAVFEADIQNLGLMHCEPMCKKLQRRVVLPGSRWLLISASSLWSLKLNPIPSASHACLTFPAFLEIKRRLMILMQDFFCLLFLAQIKCNNYICSE